MTVTVRPVTFLVAAYAADTLGETIRVTCDAGDGATIRDLAPHLSYGPSWSRGAVARLVDASLFASRGEWDDYRRHLTAALAAACRAPHLTPSRA